MTEDSRVVLSERNKIINIYHACKRGKISIKEARAGICEILNKSKFKETESVYLEATNRLDKIEEEKHG